MLVPPKGVEVLSGVRGTVVVVDGGTGGTAASGGGAVLVSDGPGMTAVSGGRGAVTAFRPAAGFPADMGRTMSSSEAQADSMNGTNKMTKRLGVVFILPPGWLRTAKIMGLLEPDNKPADYEAFGRGSARSLRGGIWVSRSARACETPDRPCPRA